MLHTKFFIPPPRAQRVARARLLDRLRATPAPPVTLVAAPAGYGKTTLVADWITGDRRVAAWLTLDSAENDPGPFWAAVATALGTVQPAASARALDLLRQPQPPLAAILTILLNDLATHLTPDAAGRPVLLVLDDYHLIAVRAIHEMVTTLIEHLPPALRLVLASRADPPLRLGRLRVRAQLLEIRTVDLAFDETETRAFLTETMGLALPTQAASTLTARTEGWAAALQLAALALRHQPDPQAFLVTFSGSHQHLFGYLVEEIFSQQPPAVQAFLLATCVLDRMCAGLCLAVLDPPPPESAAPAGGGEDGGRVQTLLEELDAANLFVVALDTIGEWYRYHPLFAETLRHQLRQGDPAAEQRYRRRASAWLAQADYGPEAIGQALAGQDWAAAAGLIEHFADGVWHRSELGLLGGWLGALPPSLLHERPRLSLLQALLLMLGNHYAAAEAWLGDVERGLARETAAAGDPLDSRDLTTLRGRAAMIHAQVAHILHADLAQATVFTHQALAQLPPDDLEWRAMTLTNQGTAAYFGDDLAGALESYAAAGALAQQAGFSLVAFLVQGRAGSVLHDLGRLQAAQALCTEARQGGAGARSGDLPGLGQIAWVEGLLRYEADDLAGAAQLLAEAITRGTQEQQVYVQGFAHLIGSQVRLAQGDTAGALQALAAATTHLAPAPDGAPILQRALAAWQALVLLAHAGPAGGPTGDLQAAARRGSGAGGPESPEPPLPLAHWIFHAWHLLPAHVLLAHGDPRGAHAYLEPLGARAEAAGAVSLLLRALALDALALDALERPAAARATLLRALTLGAAGYVRAILEAGPAIRPLLHALVLDLTRTAATYPDLLAYAYRLYAAAGGDSPPPPTPPPAGGGAPPPAPHDAILTDRELAILRLLGAGCSNQEIADQLIIGVSTVKWYLRTIYDKLESGNRTQAVARARARGLIR